MNFVFPPTRAIFSAMLRQTPPKETFTRPGFESCERYVDDVKPKISYIEIPKTKLYAS